MIISTTPFRISLAGGGTDLEKYCSNYQGKVIGFAINKYCNLFFRYGNDLMNYNYRIVYSKTELVDKINHIKHPAVKYVSKYYKIKKHFDLLHNGDLPAKSGIGSSSSFTVGLCNIFRSLSNKKPDKYHLASEAILIEQKKMKEIVGSQDQVFATYGGFNKIIFSKDKFEINKIILRDGIKKIISKNFLLMSTGQFRFAEKIEKEKINYLENKIEYFHKIKSCADEMDKNFNSSITNINLKSVGEIMDFSWKLKKNLAKNVSNPFFDELYKEAIDQGAYGGKLLGAGGGGFFLFILPSQKVNSFKKYFKKFKFIDYSISEEGSKILENSM
jgi:D-glycero-alpha-D-manno-heptose-7-phosphate kinase